MRLGWLALPLLPLLVGCGASGTSNFTVSALPNSVTLVNGGASRMLVVSVDGFGSFNQPVTVSLIGLPTGVTATPASLTVAPGSLAQFNLAASGAASNTYPTVAVVASSGPISHSIGATVSVTQPVSNVSLSALSFDFGGNLVGSTLTRNVVNVTNTGAANVTLAPTLAGDPSYSLAAGQSCSTLAPGASCSVAVNYTPTTASGSTPQTATLHLGASNVPSTTAQDVTLTGNSAVLYPGTVTATNNPQVAQYSITLPYPGAITVNFGKDTTYGRQTWTRTTTNSGQTLTMLVAGMLPNTLYHMQATVNLSNGISITDADHTFTTGDSEFHPNLVATTTPGMTPQSGVEEVTIIDNSFGLAVTDLNANILWSYALPNDVGGYSIEGAKLMANGHWLVTIGQGSSFALNGTYQAPLPVVAIREIDLAGNIVREITASDLTHELQAAGYNITLQQFHHDITPLPNGHWLVLSNTFQSFDNLPGYPGTTSVLGDVVIDLDQNLQPVWVWNSFDHLDVNRHPMGFPDWTHTNAIVYSPTDHNLIISMRHQNWVMKLDYQDGTGTGKILWHLGQGGDFKLAGGTDPTDWNYAQHYPSLFTPNSAGIFSLGMMDNGNDRMFPDGGLCGTGSEPACYTTIPVFQLDESAMTATVTFRQTLPTSLYSSWGGNTDLLANGNIEYDLAGTNTTDSDVFEVTPDPANPQTVWHMHSYGGNAYRAYRIPSLYPGVQW